MDDYRGYLVKVDGKKTFRCLAQNFYSGKLYLRLPDTLAHLDCGYCTTPSFEVSAGRCERIEEEDVAEAVLAAVLAYEEGGE
ncbi:hypothetical protein [Paenibacillus sp. FSL K6-2859]|uniref:hypothetical protein n=1 Tax=Paenibacillus sp. FSL K6-2859 TaxID=2921482 RepID=UPI0030F7F642